MAYSIDVEQEWMDVTSDWPTYKPDPDWTFTDRAGHKHGVIDGKTPTLRAERTSCYCPDCEENHDETEMVCRVCGETVEVGTVVDKPADQWVKKVPGVRSCRVTFEDAGSREVWESIGGEAPEALAAAVRFGWRESSLHALVESGGWLLSSRTDRL